MFIIKTIIYIKWPSGAPKVCWPHFFVCVLLTLIDYFCNHLTLTVLLCVLGYVSLWRCLLCALTEPTYWRSGEERGLSVTSLLLWKKFLR